MEGTMRLTRQGCMDTVGYLVAALALVGWSLGTVAFAEDPKPDEKPAEANGKDAKQAEAKGNDAKPAEAQKDPAAMTPEERIKAATVNLGDCPANERAAEYEKAQRLVGIKNDFEALTIAMAEDARDIAGQYWYARRKAWVLESRKQGASPPAVAAPNEGPGLEDDLPVCSIWAKQSPKACGVIEDARLRVTCQGAIHGILTKGDLSKCAPLEEPMRSICMLSSKDPAKCTATDPLGKGLCDYVKSSDFFSDVRCDPERVAKDHGACLFGATAIGATEGPKACEIMKPSATKPASRYAPIYAMCRAALEGDASLCDPGKAMAASREMQHEAALLTANEALEPQVAVYLRPEGESLCWARVEVSQEGQPTQMIERAVTLPDQTGAYDTVVLWPIKPDFDPFRAKVALTTSCVPRYRW